MASVSPLETLKTGDRSRLLLHAFLIAFALVMVYPLVWLAVSSLKPSSVIFSDTSIIPTYFRWQNYAKGWSGVAAPFKLFFENTFIIATLEICVKVGDGGLKGGGVSWR